MSQFNWYITTLALNDPITIICIDCLRKFSKQKIVGILIPKYYNLELESITSFMNIPVYYVDTTIKCVSSRKTAGRIKTNRNGTILSVNEEHFRLIGHGVKKFPACVIDADVWAVDNQIDNFILSKSNGCLSHRSSTLFLKEEKNLWTWDKVSHSAQFDKDLYRSFKFDYQIPFIHILSSFFKKKPKRYYNGLEELFNFLIIQKGFKKEYLISLFKKNNKRIHFLSYINNIQS